ncbi:MAG: sulfite oxidase [Bacteroidota bacterium]
MEALSRDYCRFKDYFTKRTSLKKQTKGLHQLYAEDPLRADQLLWGRTSSPLTRRGFLRRSARSAMALALGGPLVFGEHFPAGLIPAGLAHREDDFALPGKHPDLRVLNDRPINAETPPHLLDDELTPGELFFVRNNGLPPAINTIDPQKWTLRIDGEAVRRPRTFSLPELQAQFTHHRYQLTLECGGNGRKEFNPPAKGNQWSTGAVGCAEWTGVRLRDVLRAVGLRDNAVYVGYYGKDMHLSGAPDKDPISRGVPLAKAMQEESLIAWAMNGQDLPWLNGYPLRLVFGGWPASTSGKWLERLVVRDRIHDGAKMNGQSYRVPCEPVAPGTKVPDDRMCIIESMPVKSLITHPKSGALLRPGQVLQLRGHAWAGELAVSAIEYSIDFGMTWRAGELSPPANRFAWQRWRAEVEFPQTGYYEVWARARDSEGRQQPMLLPGWNPKGYLNNACHRIAVKVVEQ